MSLQMILLANLRYHRCDVASGEGYFEHQRTIAHPMVLEFAGDCDIQYTPCHARICWVHSSRRRFQRRNGISDFFSEKKS